VRVGFDPAKEAKNLAKHGLSLTVADAFDWLTEPVVPAHTVRGEARWMILATVDGVVYAAIFIIRESRPWMISLRPASRKERRRYDDTKIRRA
jgi:uncharacterized DUF497 family protein